MPEVFVGRQPIYDREQAVVGYEVRLGDAEAEPDGADAGERAARTFLTTFTEIGLDAIVGSRPAFIPFPREFVLHDYPAAFPADRVVVVIPEDTAVDDALVEAVKALAGRGYTVALADFVYQEYLHPLLDGADVVRVDVQGLEPDILG
ncbi:MAG: signal transduction protein, partial [Thermomicrobiaceae bacterium]|nr:signal transduction protein [Thermomicrobiaceae bacterium]